MDEAAVLDLARRHGLRAQSAHRHKSMGIDNEVWFVEPGFVLRTPCDPEHAKYMEGEIGIWEFALGGGVKTPEIIAHGERGDGLPYMFVRRRPGCLLGETERRPDLDWLAADIVEQLVLLHSLKLPEDHGWDRPFDHFDPWPYFRRVWDASSLSRKDLLEMEALMQRLAAYPGNYRGTDDDNRHAPDGEVMTHNDLHAWNVLVDGNPPRLVSIIDWGDACVSDRRNDLSTMPLDFQIQIAEKYRRQTKLEDGFEARLLWAWLDIALWENLNMEELGFQRHWWRWPVGGWPRVKEILLDAPERWWL